MVDQVTSANACNGNSSSISILFCCYVEYIWETSPVTLWCFIFYSLQIVRNSDWKVMPFLILSVEQLSDFADHIIRFTKSATSVHPFKLLANCKTRFCPQVSRKMPVPSLEYDSCFPVVPLI